MTDIQSTDVHQLTGESPKFQTELAKQLEELVPEAITDGKVDIVKLKELLAEDTGDTSERFGLFWPGKRRAMRAAQDPTTATLKPSKELSKNWETTGNIFIEGDNLEVLKLLQKQYHNSIKMIYIDPPYNTGKDFVYPDNFKEGLQNYLEFSKQVDAGNKKISTNTETAGRYHSNWLNMLYPRLKLARNLLSDDGVIFISIGQDEQDNLSKLCNEIFGESNRIGIVPVIMNLKGNQDAYGFADTHDYVVVYARNKLLCKFGKLIASDEEADKWEEDDYGPYKKADTLRRTGQDASRERRPKGWFPIFITPQGEIYTTTDDAPYSADDTVLWPVNDDGVELSWTWKKQKINDEKYNLLLTNRADGTYNIYKKQRLALNSQPTTKPKSVMYKAEYSTSTATTRLKDLMGGVKTFDTPKPVPYIKDLVSLGSENNSIVLDFFSGSSTTAHAVMQLNAEDGGNRKHIQVQLPEPTDEKSEAYRAGYKTIAAIARKRIDHAGEKIMTDYATMIADREEPLDIGYRVFKLADTNFTKWQSSATSDLGELQARLDLMRESADDAASEDDLLVEVMLKMGLPLTSRTQQRNVAGLNVHQVVHDTDNEYTDVQPVFYLNEHIKPTLEQLRTIVTDLTPSKFVILDDAFRGDNQLKTNLVQTCKSFSVELWTV